MGLITRLSGPVERAETNHDPAAAPIGPEERPDESRRRLAIPRSVAAQEIKQSSRSSAPCDRVRSSIGASGIALSHGLAFAAYVEESQHEVVATGLIDITGWRRWS